MEDMLSWIAEQGLVVDGPVTEPHVRPWSAALRVPTTDGLVWLKQSRSGEPALLRALQAYGTPHLLPVLAVDVERGWVLLPDGGLRLREQLDRTPDLSLWEITLGAYGALQRSVEKRNLPGVADHRPTKVPALFDDLLAALDVDASLLPDLEALRPRLVEWCRELASADVLPSLEHSDLHDGNVFWQRGAPVVFDWGDAVRAHPFASLLVTLRSVARRFSLEPGAPELARLRDAYLEPWSGVHSRTELELLALLATRLGKVTRSEAWRRAVGTGAGEWHDAAPGWLEELLEPDVF